MRNDRYLKIILTIIAASLVILVLQNANIISTAKADTEPEKKFITVPLNPDGTMDVNIKAVGGSSVYGPLDVNIEKYDGSSVSSYGLPVNIESVDGSSIYDAIPVKMK